MKVQKNIANYIIGLLFIFGVSMLVTACSSNSTNSSNSSIETDTYEPSTEVTLDAATLAMREGYEKAIQIEQNLDKQTETWLLYSNTRKDAETTRPALYKMELDQQGDVIESDEVELPEECVHIDYVENHNPIGEKGAFFEIVTSEDNNEQLIKAYWYDLNTWLYIDAISNYSDRASDTFPKSFESTAVLVDDYVFYATGERGKFEGNSPYKAEETTLWKIRSLKNNMLDATIPVPDSYRQPKESEGVFLEPGIALIAYSETTGDRIVFDEAKELVYYWEKEMTYKTWLPLLEKYNKATEAISWFEMSTIQIAQDDRVTLKVDLDNSGTSYEYDYYRVNYPSINTLNDLKVYLSQLFSDDVVAQLMKNPRFQEVDGVLYALMADRGSDITKGSPYYGGHKIDNNQYSFDVFVELLKVDQEPYGNVIGFEHASFPLEEYNGVLRFNEFHLLY